MCNTLVIKQNILPWNSHMLSIIYLWKHRSLFRWWRVLTIHSSFFSSLANQIIRDKKSSATNTSHSSCGSSFSALLALSRSFSSFFSSIFHALFHHNLTFTRRQCRKRKYLYQWVAASRYTASFLTRAPIT